MIAPRSCAQVASRSSGLTVPSELETRFAATTLHVPVTGRAVEVAEVELALVVERDHPEVGAGALRDVLPGHEVRVVLELGHEDDVARAEVDEPPGVGDEVQRPRSRSA